MSCAHERMLTVDIQGYWEVNMDNVQGNGKMILSNIDAIVDTGTSLIVGSPSSVSELYSALGGKSASNSGPGFYTCEFCFECTCCSLIDTP